MISGEGLQGAIVMLKCRSGRYLLLQENPENVNKYEKSSCEPNYFEVKGLEFPGGGVKEGETIRDAAKRESWEEALLWLFPFQLHDAAFGMYIDQSDRGSFRVHVFEAELNILQELWLKLFRGAIEMVTDNQNNETIRTRDEIALTLAGVIAL